MNKLATLRRRCLASLCADNVCPCGRFDCARAPARAVSAADARGTTFENVKGARDRLRGKLSVQRMDGDELVKSATACAPAQSTPELDEEAWLDATTKPASANV